MLNHITLMGRLTRDPELKKTQNDLSVVRFSLAVERDYSAGGEKQTDFINCVAWRHTAEFVSKYFKKGSMAAVSGRLQNNSYTDKDGNKRESAEVLVDSMYFADSKKPDGGQTAPVTAAKDVTPEAGNNGFKEYADDGDLPF